MASGAAALISQINRFNLAATEPIPTYHPPEYHSFAQVPSGWGSSSYHNFDASGIPHPGFWDKFAGPDPYGLDVPVGSTSSDSDDGLRTLRSRLRHLREDEPKPSIVMKGLRRLRMPTVPSPISDRVRARRAALGSIV